MSNYKGLVQEYCQKHNLAFPVYKNHSQGPPHCPDWTTCVTFCDRQWTSTRAKTKTESEQQAAKLVWVSLISNVKENDINVQLNVDSTDRSDVRPGDIISFGNDSGVESKTQRHDVIAVSNDSEGGVRIANNLDLLVGYNTQTNGNEVQRRDNISDKKIVMEKCFENKNNNGNKTNKDVSLLVQTKCNSQPPYHYYHILIDIENIQPNLDHYALWLRKQTSKTVNICLHFFASTFSTIKMDRYIKCGGNVTYIATGEKNAADHLMTFCAAEIAASSNPTSTLFVVVSRDAASCVLVHILEKMRGFRVQSFQKANAFESFLKTILN